MSTHITVRAYGESFVVECETAQENADVALMCKERSLDFHPSTCVELDRLSVCDVYTFDFLHAQQPGYEK